MADGRVPRGRGKTGAPWNDLLLTDLSTEAKPSISDEHFDTVTADPQPQAPQIDRVPGWLRLGRSRAHGLLRSRRRTLLAMGVGVAAATAVGSSVAVAVGQSSPATSRRGRPRDAGSFSDRDASYSAGASTDLGAAGVADSPSRAAAAALKATPKLRNPLSREPVRHLLRRLTFGPTPAEEASVRQLGIDAWIDRQLKPDAIPDPTGDLLLTAFPLIPMSIAQVRASVKENGYEAMYQLSRITLGRQMWSSRQLNEAMVDFWANHLNVTNPLDSAWDSRSSYDRDVIRAHALGKFSDMLLASAQHPAMMRYLNNDVSTRKSVNENYGRELLELHTVGIDGGYTEVDVRNSAYLMSGRTVDRDTGAFRYDPNRHWLGAVKVLDFSHPNKNAAEGFTVGEQYLRYLATHPSTAHYIARKLAVRFVCDSPPPDLVNRLAKEYLANDTAIVPVLRLLLRSLEFWIATGAKHRRPAENVVATARILGVQPGGDLSGALESIFRLTRDLGNAPLNWGPPNGYADVAPAWNSAFGTLGTWNSHRSMLAGQYKGLTYPGLDQLVSNRPATVGAYLDALASALVGQPLSTNERNALLKFLGGDPNKPADATLGGKLSSVAALLLDSACHCLR